jgi:hypothetical protein
VITSKSLVTLDWTTYRQCLADQGHFDSAEHVERVAGKELGAAADSDQSAENVKQGFPGSTRQCIRLST